MFDFTPKYVPIVHSGGLMAVNMNHVQDINLCTESKTVNISMPAGPIALDIDDAQFDRLMTMFSLQNVPDEDLSDVPDDAASEGASTAAPSTL